MIASANSWRPEEPNRTVAHINLNESYPQGGVDKYLQYGMSHIVEVGAYKRQNQLTRKETS